jgi:hypothetical protein
VRSISELLEISGLRAWWVYRGQGSWKWRLSPTIERRSQRGEWLRVEQEELAALRGRTTTDPTRPGEDDHAGWLARLRHAERPVRLLDFTRSLAVAVHFAVREASPDVPVVWALDGIRLEVAWRNQMTPPEETLLIRSAPGNCEEFNQLYTSQTGARVAMLIEPRTPNDRQERQHGLFLVGLDLSSSLEESLFGCLGHSPGRVNPLIGERGLPTGPVGYYRSPVTDSARRQLMDALVVQIWLEIPRDELLGWLHDEGVSDSSLGL